METSFAITLAFLKQWLADVFKSSNNTIRKALLTAYDEEMDRLFPSARRPRRDNRIKRLCLNLERVVCLAESTIGKEDDAAPLVREIAEGHFHLSPPAATQRSRHAEALRKRIMAAARALRRELLEERTS